MSRKETDNTDRKKQLRQSLLDSYFQFRSPLPCEGYYQENKTTQQIQDELEPMLLVDALGIAEYMDDHDYSFITEQDGTVRWAIWRQA